MVLLNIPQSYSEKLANAFKNSIYLSSLQGDLKGMTTNYHDYHSS